VKDITLVNQDYFSNDPQWGKPCTKNKIQKQSSELVVFGL
jgi:hypothetical protein